MFMISLKNLSVKLQIALPIVLLALLIALVGVKSLITVNGVIAQTDIAINNLTPATTAVLNADRDLYQAEPKPAMVQSLCAAKGALKGRHPLQFQG